MTVQFHSLLIYIEFILAAVVLLLLFFVPAPYGKHHRKGWGPHLGSGAAWVLMEFPAVAITAIYFVHNLGDQSPVSTAFLIIWMSHYLYRTFIYPFTTNDSNKPFPLVISLFGFIFNCLNANVIGAQLFYLDIQNDPSWLLSIPFLTGLSLFILGMFINKQSEFILARLKKEGKGSYLIPRGGLFGMVSNPHYLGEIIEWLGWAILTWSISGLAFFVFTFANLFPRAITAHRWYKMNFKDYPPDRKALIPGIV